MHFACFIERRKTYMKKALTLATAVLTVSTLCSIIALPVSASTKPLPAADNRTVTVTYNNKAATPVKNDDQYYATFLFVSNCQHQIGVNDVVTYVRETDYYLSHNFTACDYLDRVFSSRQFLTKTYKMNDRTYINTVYRIVLNRLPTSAEMNRALLFLSKKSSDRVLLNGFILQRAYTVNAFYSAYPDLDYGDPYDDDLIWNMW